MPQFANGGIVDFDYGILSQGSDYDSTKIHNPTVCKPWDYGFQYCHNPTVCKPWDYDSTMHIGYSVIGYSVKSGIVSI